MAQLRGIFPLEEPEYWQDAIENFPNQVPRFRYKQEAEAFIRKYCEIPSNPVEPHLHHSISTLTDWNQIETYLLPKIDEYRNKFDSSPVEDNMKQDNRFLCPTSSSTSSSTVTDYLMSRLNLPVHCKLSSMSTMNTLLYLFHHLRCGIYVMIRNNQVVIFCPFVNKDYLNTWSDTLQLESIDNTIETYSKQKSKIYRHENYIDKNRWWANGNIICNVLDQPTQYWGDQFLFQLKDMIAETCNNRMIPDCEFFINKRDYPQLKYNMKQLRAVEPYGFIYDKDDRLEEEDIDLTRHLYKAYTPIMSFYSSKRFADIPIPPSEDWEAATGEVFPSSFNYSHDAENQLVVGNVRDLFTTDNLKKFERSWDDKIPTAFFRGTATGGGVTVETNQRLHVAYISHKLSLDPNYNTTNPSGYSYLDAKITGLNTRDKKIATSKMTYIKRADFTYLGNTQSNFIPIYEQSKYKYVVYVEGHCAACRYGFMMQLGSVILKVDSKCVADQMWYFPLLQPYIDHVPVKADLSDLVSQIQWCRDNDEKCREMVQNAKKLYDAYISREGVLDYMQAIMIGISERYLSDPQWMQGAGQVKTVKKPQYSEYNSNGKERCCAYVKGKEELCSTCLLIQQREEKERLETKKRTTELSEGDRNRKELRKMKKQQEIERLRVERLQNAAKEAAKLELAQATADEASK